MSSELESSTDMDPVQDAEVAAEDEGEYDGPWEPIEDPLAVHVPNFEAAPPSRGCLKVPNQAPRADDLKVTIDPKTPKTRKEVLEEMCSAPKGIVYRAIAAYTSDDEDDLQFKLNDLILVIDEGDGPDDWWEGVMNGKRGTFPGTFVKKMNFQPEDTSTFWFNPQEGQTTTKEEAAPEPAPAPAPEQSTPQRRVLLLGGFEHLEDESGSPDKSAVDSAEEDFDDEAEDAVVAEALPPPKLLLLGTTAENADVDVDTDVDAASDGGSDAYVVVASSHAPAAAAPPAAATTPAPTAAAAPAAAAAAPAAAAPAAAEPSKAAAAADDDDDDDDDVVSVPRRLASSPTTVRRRSENTGAVDGGTFFSSIHNVGDHGDRSSSLPSHVFRTGWLNKKGGGSREEGRMQGKVFARRNWKTRWFLLEDNILRYYKSAIKSTGVHPPKPLGVIILCKDTTVESAPNNPHLFYINCPTRRYCICAPGGDDAKQWVKVLNEGRDLAAAASGK